MVSAIRQQLIEQIDRLTPAQQVELLRYAASIEKPSAKGVPGKALLPLAGSLSAEDAEIMMRVIEEDCGRIDLNEW